MQRLAVVGAAVALTAVVGACSASQGPATDSQAPVNEPAATPSVEAAAPTGSGVTKISDIFGPACDQVPKSGEGSAAGMVDDPVATAASNNPLLTTLVKAVTAANLGDTLNSSPALTVFAPADPAFQALEAQNPGILKELTTASDVASPNSKLAKILTYHVVGKRYDAAGIVSAGSLDSLQGAKINIGGTSAAPTVNGATVLCGNIPTQNATVFVIGQVLSPPAS
ncbi:MAG: fasciclin domain-containing protein [Pseudonocardiaceae bacterium]